MKTDMTAAEINREIERLAPEERTKVRAFLTHFERANDRDYLESLDRRIARMQAGRALSAEELQQLAAILDKTGE